MPPSLFQVLNATTYIDSASAATASSARIYEMNIADGALLNETAWSALVGMRKREAREAAKAELAAE